MNKLFFNPATALQKSIRKSKELNAERMYTLESTMNTALQHKVPFDLISLENKIILCAYIRACADESLEKLLPIGQDQHSIRLSPSKEYSYMLIGKLLMEKIIRLESKENEFSSYSVSTNRTLGIQIDTSAYSSDLDT